MPDEKNRRAVCGYRSPLEDNLPAGKVAWICSLFPGHEGGHNVLRSATAEEAMGGYLYVRSGWKNRVDRSADRDYRAAAASSPRFLPWGRPDPSPDRPGRPHPFGDLMSRAATILAGAVLGGILLTVLTAIVAPGQTLLILSMACVGAGLGALGAARVA